MTLPILPDLNVDFSNSNCACCSNNQRVLYNEEEKVFYLDRRGSSVKHLFSRTTDADREKNARTWNAFSRVITSYGVSLPQAAPPPLVEKEKNQGDLKLSEFNLITRRARALREELLKSSESHATTPRKVSPRFLSNDQLSFRLNVNLHCRIVDRKNKRNSGEEISAGTVRDIILEKAPTVHDEMLEKVIELVAEEINNKHLLEISRSEIGEIIKAKLDEGGPSS